MIIRKINIDDYYKGIIELLQGLSNFNKTISFTDFKNNIDITNRHIYIIEENGIIIGTGTLFILNKLHCNPIAHIEDIIIDTKYRNKGFASTLIKYLIDISNTFNCYKIILNCKEHNVSFYEKNSFIKTGYEMCIRLSV